MVRQWNHENGVSSGNTGGSNPTGNPTVNPDTSPDTDDDTPVSYDNGGLSPTGISTLQRALGVKADGKWGPETAAAAKEKWGVSSAAEAYQKYTGGQDKDADGWKDNPAEEKMYTYVKNMLNNALKNGSSQFNPKAVINANSSLTAAEKKVALEILDEYISIGYMK
jgi:hypothetical protein